MLSHEETEEGSYEGDVDREDGVPADELDELGGYEAKAEADEGAANGKLGLHQEG